MNYYVEIFRILFTYELNFTSTHMSEKLTSFFINYFSLEGLKFNVGLSVLMFTRIFIITYTYFLVYSLYI